LNGAAKERKEEGNNEQRRKREGKESEWEEGKTEIKVKVRVEGGKEEGRKKETKRKKNQRWK
jgi:hypothetical protein